jgi:hypothetical protein
MQTNLFNTFQILLIKGNVSMGDNDNIEIIFNELGFSQDKISINGQTPMETKNLYSTMKEGKDVDEVIFSLKEKIYESCKANKIGMFDFFLIDATNSKMFKSLWHDGYY